MSDFDKGQLNSIGKKYPESKDISLCWWHVLHAWQQHFIVFHYPELWELLKGWLRIADPDKFEQKWLEIKVLAPDSVIDYLTDAWFPVKHMWLAVFRVGRMIWQISDTNMLVEAWHHVLKGKFLEGKRNRRVDHLLHVLLDRVVPYYIARRHRQDCGFEGPNLEVKKRREVTEHTETIGKDTIQVVETSGKTYQVKSQSGSHQYDVDIDAYHCLCLSFLLINFCKHICAVQTHYPVHEGSGGDTFVCDASETATEFVAEPGTELDDKSNADEEDDIEIEISISSLVDKLHSLSLRTHLQPPSGITDNLKILDQALDNVFDDLGILPDEKILPQRKNVPSHQGSGWEQAKEVMGTKRKLKKIRRHADPYSGREASGRKAAPDAREPKQRKINMPQESTSTLISSPCLPIIPSISYQPLISYPLIAPPSSYQPVIDPMLLAIPGTVPAHPF
ncbi:hypothetical protein C8J56DRAFT_1057962 [Mycena floridula]|nr:hypothetical protein C8J56DRAFT_1057962 [Mycena floridula]